VDAGERLGHLVSDFGHGRDDEHVIPFQGLERAPQAVGEHRVVVPHIRAFGVALADEHARAGLLSIDRLA
jgi:hypothetical protein